MSKKLLIGIPAYDGIVAECQENILSLAFRLGRETDLQVAVQVVIKKEQFRARNSIVSAALGGNFDYLLMLDDDMVVPHHLFQTLAAHDKEVVGALYYQRGGLFRPVAMRENQLGTFTFLNHTDPIIVDNPGLHEVDVIGGGCMLFKTEVFKKMLPPYFHWERELGTDIAICSRLRELGYKVWLDTSVELGHIGKKQVITSRTIPIEQRVTNDASEMLGKDLEAYYDMPGDWVRKQMEESMSKASRKEAWGDRGQDWESVRSYYKENNDWQIFNLAGFNIWAEDACRTWALSQGTRMIGKEGAFLDYGCGLGYVSVPMAQQARRVYAVDIEDSPAVFFTKWRAVHHELKNLSVIGINSEVPLDPLPELVDGAAMISVLNHLTDPYRAVLWVRDQLKPGGFLILDWALHSNHDDGNEPQHLDCYDVGTFRAFMIDSGFEISPEHPWLFFKR